MRTSRTLTALAAMLLLTLGLAACGSDGGSDAKASTPTTSASDGGGLYGGGAPSAATKDGTVKITDFAFSPKTLKVAVGTTVTVTNDDTASHTWTFDDGSFDAGTLAPGKSASHTFDAAGTFSYHCEIHPGMKGTIEVG